MKSEVFSNKQPWATQRVKAEYFLNRLRSSELAEIPCDSYASSIALAHLLSRIDRERLCAAIHVFSTFVRIIRNEKGSFAFPAITLDHVKNTCKAGDDSEFNPKADLSTTFGA